MTKGLVITERAGSEARTDVTTMRDSSPKAPTLSDVARAAGVSPYTVSVVLNGARSNTRVSDTTRKRILDSAADLRYHPNALARSLAKRQTNTLGVLFGVVQSTAALSNAYASGILQGIVAHAAARGYDVLLYTELWKDAEQSAARYRDRRTDGVIVVAPLTDMDVVAGLSTLHLPLVAVSAAPDACPEGVPNLDVDNGAGVRSAVDHLASLGHRRIAHLTGDANVASVPLRRAAFEGAMAERGLAVPPGYVVPCTYDAHTVPDALPPLLLSRPDPPTAVFAGNDNIAIAVLEFARRNGLRVPEDLSVVGFDDIPAASQVTPALTTLHQPLPEIGGAAADALLDLLEPSPAGQDAAAALSPVPPTLIVRESTGPAPDPG